MKLYLDDIFDLEIKEYLLKQNGIENVLITNRNFISEIDITCNEEVTSAIIAKYIQLYLNIKFSFLLEFDKKVNYGIKKLTYVIDDMCCEYCYKALVTELFINENIKSFRSNFDITKPLINIKMEIEFNEELDEQEIINYINEKL